MKVRFFLMTVLFASFLVATSPPTLAQWPSSETRLVVVITGLPEDEQVRIYIDGSENGIASLTSPLVRTLSRGSVINITADIYVEGSWGYSYELTGVRRGSAPPETQPSVLLDSDLVVVICEYSSHHILFSALLIPLYALLILIGFWSVVRWLSGFVQPSQKERPTDDGK